MRPSRRKGPKCRFPQENTLSISGFWQFHSKFGPLLLGWIHLFCMKTSGFWDETNWGHSKVKRCLNLRETNSSLHLKMQKLFSGAFAVSLGEGKSCEWRSNLNGPPCSFGELVPRVSLVGKPWKLEIWDEKTGRMDLLGPTGNGSEIW